MSTITMEDDLARIDAIKHRHLMDHNPGDGHWRDVDALLHVCTLHQGEIRDIGKSHDADLESVYREHRDELEDLRAGHRSDLAERDRELADYENRIAGYDRDLMEANRSQAILNDTIERLNLRWDWLVGITRLFASRSGPEHRAMLDRKLDSLKPVQAPGAPQTAG